MNFLNINPCLVHVLKFLCVQHTFLLYRLHTSLWHFLIFILSGKDGRSSWSWWRSLKYSTSSSNICILYRYFHHALFRNSSSNFDVSFFHLHLSFGNFWDILILTDCLHLNTKNMMVFCLCYGFYVLIVCSYW